MSRWGEARDRSSGSPFLSRAYHSTCSEHFVCSVSLCPGHCFYEAGSIIISTLQRMTSRLRGSYVTCRGDTDSKFWSPDSDSRPGLLDSRACGFGYSASHTKAAAGRGGT